MKTLTLTLIGGLAALVAHGQQQMFSDEFDGTTLDPRWILINPNTPSSVVDVNDGTLHLHASPEDGGSDYFMPTNFDGPRILQAACGNWRLEVAFTAVMSSNFQGAGILVLDHDTSTAMEGDRWLERRFNDQCGGPATHGFWLLDTLLCGLEQDDDTMIIQLEKIDSLVTARVRVDQNPVWISAIDTIASNVQYVGLCALRYDYDGNATTSTDAYFDYFRFLDMDTLSIQSSDTGTICVGAPVTLWVDSISGGTYSWSSPVGVLPDTGPQASIPAVSVADSGWYHVTVSSLNCSFLTDSFLVSIEPCMGLSAWESLDESILQPNPTSDFLTVALPGASGLIERPVFVDQMGKVFHLQPNAQPGPADRSSTLQYDVNVLPTGMYSVRFIDAERSYVARLIKL